MAVVEIALSKKNAVEIAHRRYMERQRLILWKNYIATSSLYMAMLGKPHLFDNDETGEQYKISQAAEAAHTAIDEAYHYLYQQPGGELA